MRKATAVTTVLLLIVFGVMLFLADRALEPLARDGRLGKDLTRALEHRGDIEVGSKARVRRIRADASDLAGKGQGVRIRLVPSEAVRSRRGGMARLATLAAEEVIDAYDGRAPDWVEVVFELEPGDETREPREARILLRETLDGLSAEGPALPSTWPPRPPRASRRPTTRTRAPSEAPAPAAAEKDA